MNFPAEIRSFWAKNRKLSLRLVAAGTLLIAVPLGVHAKSEVETRYPFDPACPWGRLSNGKGMIHRCLEQREAEDLARKDDAEGRTPLPADNKKVKEEGEKAQVKAESGAAKEAKPVPGLLDYELEVGPIKAESGDITVGHLNKPMDKYRQCVDQKGGLKAKKAEVIVKFLVRGEKVRAEGVSVESYKGVSKEAANCIAEVVDRRQVGAPTVPLTAARLTFAIQAK